MLAVSRYVLPMAEGTNYVVEDWEQDHFRSAGGSCSLGGEESDKEQPHRYRSTTRPRRHLLEPPAIHSQRHTFQLFSSGSRFMALHPFSNKNLKYFTQNVTGLCWRWWRQVVWHGIKMEQMEISPTGR